MTRLCDRPGCGDGVEATLAYEYSSRTVWLDDAAPAAHPATYDLCRRHAENLSAPMGWRVQDRRTGVQAVLHVVAS